MRILLTFDTNYAPHAATTMESIIRNCPQKLDFVVLYCDLNADTQDILANHFAEHVNSLEFVRVDESLLKNISKDAVNVASHLATNTTYLRILTPILLREDHHILYLDCDIIVQDDIRKISENADLSKPLCAVTMYDMSYKSRDLLQSTLPKPTMDTWLLDAYHYRTYRDLEMDLTAKSFNSGVMILNLDYWREHRITERTLNFAIEKPERIMFADQCALNHAINGNFYPLHPRWNFLESHSLSIFNGYDENVLKDAAKNPGIIHVLGASKPWNYLCETKYQNLYWKYRKHTPWAQKHYPNKTLKNILTKNIKMPIEKLIGERTINRIKRSISPNFAVSKISKLRVR